ncbi:hypothetical protein [Natranaerobius trueperi]|uniref:Zn-finger containing protein n=1 Tax=Natranaerobius trueperi TaxID=759412 RepID=A0A226BYJ2_9FIRM|nr:hypothetical protein [Natranaerobius trueperi]OWZ83404.1 hypothetical protein CDO51_08885 [Natranaerobius trueperi]
MKWLKNFMIGRYGLDQLSIALIVLALFFSVLAPIIQNPVLEALYIVTIVILFYRILSKDITKRSQENRKFLEFWSPIRKKFSNKKNRLKNSRYYRYYNCPNCKQDLRVPKGKGNIIITCPKCTTKLSKKT